jgi:hypothetical protein
MPGRPPLHLPHEPVHSQSDAVIEGKCESNQEDGREGPTQISIASHRSQEGQSHVTLNFQAIRTGSAAAGPVPFRLYAHSFSVLPSRARLVLAHPTGLNTLPMARCWFPTHFYSAEKVLTFLNPI